MKSRKLLAAAIAALASLSFGVADTSAAETGLAKAVATSSTRGTVAAANAAPAQYSYSDDTAACDPCDAGNACDVCHDCCGPSPWFVEAEGLLWWRKSRPLPPLLTTSLPGTQQPSAGVLGEATTRTLFGGDNYQDGPQAGARISFGRWIDPDQCTGVAANFYILGQDSVDSSVAATSINDIIAAPFFNSSLAAEDALLINFPGVTTNGRASVQYQNDVLGGDAYVRRLLYLEETLRIDAIGGYQFARIDDGLQLNANYNDLVAAPNANLDVQDNFLAKNEFHGGTLGLLARVDSGLWTVKALAKCGLGNMHQSVDISGRTIVTPVAGAVTTTPGGLFTQGTNIGSYSNNEFAVIPEGKLNIGYRATENWTFGVGYSFIYYSDVMTAGRAIDRNVNLTQIPGPLVGAAVPAPPTFANTSDFWVQGLNFSAEFAY